jgi:DNA-binding IclR family transcriptional regulator
MARDLDQLTSLPDKEDEESKKRHFIVALARGLEVLRAFSSQGGLLTNREIAAATKIPRPTVSRLTYTLTRLGYLSYDPKLERYQLGPGVLSLGYAFLSNLDIRAAARPVMQELANQADAYVGLTTRDRLEMLYLDVCRGVNTVDLRLDIGSRLPLMRTAAGLAYVAHLAEPVRETLIAAVRDAYPEEWPVMAADLERTSEEIRTNGFCVMLGKYRQAVNSAGTAFLAPDGVTVLAFNVVGPAFLIDERKLREELGPRLAFTVQSVEAKLARNIGGHRA